MPAVQTLSLRDLGRATLARQLLLAREKMSVAKALERLLAIQAQWPKPPFIALHSRLAGFERQQLSTAARKNLVVRGTAFRATIFLLAATDYAAFRGTIQPTLERGAAAIVKDAVPPKDQARLVAFGRELFASSPRSFEELRKELAKKATRSDDVRRQAYLIRMRVPLLQVPTDARWGWHAACDFALAESLVATPIDMRPRNDELVIRYLAALGPATIADAQNFTGVTRLKESFERLRPKLVTLRGEDEKELFNLATAPRPGADADAPVRFLPDFDNVVMGHLDRRRFVADEHKTFIYLKGLVVNRTYLVDGRVAGTWKIEVKKDRATLHVQPFATAARKVKAALEEEGERLVRFVEAESSAYDLRFAKPLSE